MIKSKELPPKPIVSGWIARDQDDDPFLGTGLHLHYAPPYRDGNVWSANTLQMHLPWDAFPEITWEDEPVEVEMYIIRKNLTK